MFRVTYFQKALSGIALAMGVLLLATSIAQATFREVDINAFCPDGSAAGDECGMDNGRPTTEGTCQAMGGEAILVCTAPEETAAPPLTSVTTGVSDTGKAAAPVEPTFAVNIPTVSLADVQISSNDRRQFIDIPWIADYITGVYKYAVFIASILAAVMMMVGGIQWLTSAGNSSRVSAAKKRITDALIGLVLVLGSYLVLSTINPELVALKPLRVTTVQEEIFHTLGDAPSSAGPGGDYVPLGPATGEANRDALYSACVSGTAGTIDDLRRILPIWVDLGRRGAAVYVRGGWTGRTGCSFNNSPQSWVPNELRRRDISFSESTPISDLEEIYADQVVARIFAAGRMCGDCVSWTQQLFKCAGRGRILITDMKTSGSQYLIATGATCREAAANVSGGLQFGDVFYSDNVGHMFTYTGGAGLGYEVIEMGGQVQSRTTIPGVGGSHGIASITAHASLESYYTFIDRPRSGKTETTGGKRGSGQCRVFRYIQ